MPSQQQQNQSVLIKHLQRELKSVKAQLADAQETIRLLRADLPVLKEEIRENYQKTLSGLETIETYLE